MAVGSAEITISFTIHKNIPNMLTQISGAVSALGLNIEKMANESKKEYAYTILDVDELVGKDAAASIMAIDGVIKVRVIV